MRAGFVDTNVLVYAATGAVDERVKWLRALEFLEDGPYSLSGQVLAEFYSIAVRKHRLKLAEVERWLTFLENFTVQAIDRGVVLAGIALSQRYQISYWDAALIAAAKRLDETTLYTEDLNHGQSYEGVRIVNPFIEN
ncbi:PIN domain-containing protein [Aurantimonas marianensis]|uniref:Ribonuclease VapC n=1 Tax=Aurantimonas marianensis TaxID=2920428 RepID=A0A9X2KG42_9HYPH|nr:PIN domain-containing protein [Aurantimonas marianensis]MCP3057143.1 PIN domain-containing protein [Aurantimonas marianensis]